MYLPFWKTLVPYLCNLLVYTNIVQVFSQLFNDIQVLGDSYNRYNKMKF